MIRPEAYSSDEFDDDGFDYFSGPTQVVTPIVTELSQQEIYAQLLDTLYSEIYKGNVEEVIRIMDENNLPVDVELPQETTPLLLAASCGHPELSKKLIVRGADINQVKDTNTVLMHACSIARCNSNFDKVVDLVKYLVEHKADLKVLNKQRMNAFLLAASTGNVEVVKFLMEFYDKYVVDNQGWNALFFAVNDNHIELVRYLLDVNMDYKKYDVRRNTVLDYARKWGFNEIVQMIPDEEIYEKRYETYLCENYDFVQEIENPRFIRDVNIMLYGMNCGALLEKVNADPNLDLFKFLTTTKEDLIQKEIIKPYEQNRILGGIYRFHKHEFKYKSIPHIKKTTVLTTYDVGFILITALRHYVSMKASLRYLKLNAVEWKPDLLFELQVIENRLQTAKKLIQHLQNKCLQWEKENAKVDLITFPRKRPASRIPYLVPIISAVSIVLYFKYRL